MKADNFGISVVFVRTLEEQMNTSKGEHRKKGAKRNKGISIE
jgi:hypothetical protein